MPQFDNLENKGIGGDLWHSVISLPCNLEQGMSLLGLTAQCKVGRMKHHLFFTSLSIREDCADGATEISLEPTSRQTCQETLGPFLPRCRPGLPAWAASLRSYSQAPSPPLMCFPILSATCPLRFEDSTAWPAPPHIWRDFLRPHGLEPAPPADLPTRLAAGMQADPPGTGACLPEEDVSSLLWAQGPGSGALSSPRFIYLSFVWGEIGENQIQ